MSSRGQIVKPAVTAGRTHATPPRGERPVTRSPLSQGRFGRMFRRLDPCPAYDDDVLTALAESMQDLPPGEGNNERIPAAYTYLGQFIDHDITFDPVSSLDQANDPDALVNFRTPRLDLDCVYGSGPADEPFQYERDGRRLIVDQENVRGEPDLPRNENGTALIGDPRNDENTIVSQLQLVFIRLHNRFVDQVEEEMARGARVGGTDSDVCAEAQRRTRWHYQYMVLHDFLPRTVGEETMRRVIVDGHLIHRHYRPKQSAFMPVEFSGAAYRFGHSQVRGRYDLNEIVTARPIFAPGDDVDELDDLRGFRPLPRAWTIDWRFYLELDDAHEPQLSRDIDAHLARGLFDLPGPAGALAFLNLKRGQALELPSGQDVARYLGVEPIPRGELGDAAPIPTPLWFYILKESELRAGGKHLGPTGGLIVAEVFAGLLHEDRQAYGNVDPQWKPQPPVAPAPGRLELKDLVRFALDL